MNKYFNILSLSLLSFLMLTACKGPKSVAQSADVLPHALLWKIEKADQSQPSYLFGTIHMIPKGDFFLPEGLDEAFDKRTAAISAYTKVRP